MANLIKDSEALAGFIIGFGFGIGLASALFAVMVIAL